ncbi:hypothetical protein CL630_00800 [bacterium]|nr:hypothetical protein [bacterium]|tara:strand:+ start:139 stop:882 length:744 start_codon:yes stop_codon:yes gene_type:complete
MRNNNLITILNDLGLSENESQVYLSALSLGPTTIQKIARTAEIKRTTVYTVVESLKKRGLVSIDVKGFKKLYVAESPEKLDRIIEERHQQLHKQLPEFMSLYNLQGGESFIKYYEGKEGVKSVYESMIRDIKPGEKYMVMANASKVFDLYGKWFYNFIERRAKLNINIRMLFQDDDLARDHKKYEKNYNHTIKFLPKDTKLITNLVVTPQRVLIHQLNQPIIGIVIENKSVIQMHQQTFELLWKTAK